MNIITYTKLKALGKLTLGQDKPTSPDNLASLFKDPLTGKVLARERTMTETGELGPENVVQLDLVQLQQQKAAMLQQRSEARAKIEQVNAVLPSIDELIGDLEALLDK